MSDVLNIGIHSARARAADGTGPRAPAPPMVSSAPSTHPACVSPRLGPRRSATSGRPSRPGIPTPKGFARSSPAYYSRTRRRPLAQIMGREPDEPAAQLLLLEAVPIRAMTCPRRCANPITRNNHAQPNRPPRPDRGTMWLSSQYRSERQGIANRAVRRPSPATCRPSGKRTHLPPLVRGISRDPRGHAGERLVSLPSIGCPFAVPYPAALI